MPLLLIIPTNSKEGNMMTITLYNSNNSLTPEFNHVTQFSKTWVLLCYIWESYPIQAQKR